MGIDTQEVINQSIVVKFLKEGIISLSLHKIRCKNKNPFDTTIPFYNQNGESSVDLNGVNC